MPLVAAGIFWSPVLRGNSDSSPRSSTLPPARARELAPSAEGSRSPSGSPARSQEGRGSDRSRGRRREARAAVDPDRREGRRKRSGEVRRRGEAEAPNPSARKRPTPIADALGLRAPDPGLRAAGLAKSQFGGPVRQDREFDLPEDADDRFEILNAAGLPARRRPPRSKPWEIATKTGSGLGGGFTLAQLVATDARTWQFEWTKDASKHSTRGRGPQGRDPEFQARDGRPIRVLLRGVEPRDDRPLASLEESAAPVRSPGASDSIGRLDAESRCPRRAPVEAEHPPLEGS